MNLQIKPEELVNQYQEVINQGDHDALTLALENIHNHAGRGIRSITFETNCIIRAYKVCTELQSLGYSAYQDHNESRSIRIKW